MPLLGPGQSMSISYTVKIDDHAWKKTVLNKAYGSGAVEPAQCMVSRPVRPPTAHQSNPGLWTRRQIRLVTTRHPNHEEARSAQAARHGASVTLGMLLLALGLGHGGRARTPERRRQG
ncbi:MAG: hypothetical protein R2709_10275 [Marmoricola sp.]